MRKCPGAKLPRGSQETAEFRAAYFAAIAGKPIVAPPTKLDRKARDGTWNKMIGAHKLSSDWAKFVNKSDRERAFERIRNEMKIGDALVAKTDFVLVGQYIDKLGQEKSGEAKTLRTALSMLCGEAIKHKLLAANPIREIKLPKSENVDGIADWSEDEIAQYEARHSLGTLARYALDAGLETGLRVSDLCRVGDQFVDKDGLISIIPEKTKRLGERARCFIPYTDKLRESGASMTVVGKDRWLVTMKGKVFKPDYLSAMFERWIDEAGLPEHCKAHGLRKSFVRRHIDAGHAPTDVAAMTGHQSLELVMYYARKRDKRLAARRVQAAVA